MSISAFDGGVGAESSGLQRWPRRLRDIQMHAVVFSPDANGGPGAPKFEITPDMLNVTWQQVLNGASQAAFSVTRFQPKQGQFEYMKDHIKIYRETDAGVTCVFAGKLVKPSKGPRDTIVWCWDYMSFLQRSRTGYRTLYPNQSIGAIVSAEWALAKNVGTSPFAFVATGTIEAPLALDGVTPIVVNDQFGVVDFDRLFTFYAMAEMAMANTDNVVVFEITRETPHTFNFWKNRTTQRTSAEFVHPGDLIDYDHSPGHDEIQNDIASVVYDSATGQNVEFVVTDNASIAEYRRLQSAMSIKTLYGISSGTTETDQQKAAIARMLTQADQTPKLITVYPRQQAIEPFVGWTLGDSFRVTLQNAARTGDELDAFKKVIGIAASWTPDSGELLQLFLR